jgi:hypothetical protein
VLKSIFLNEYGSLLIECAGGTLAFAMRRMPFEIIIGRGMACCLHPTAAWRVLSRSGRALVVGAYAGAGFLTTLVALLLI